MKVHEIVYETMQSIRKRYGLTLDNICAAAHKYGATWTPGFLNGMKRNRSAASLPNLLVLCKCLSDLTGEQILLPDLFDGKDPVELDNGAKIGQSDIRKALNGRPYHIVAVSVIDAAATAIISEIPNMLKQLSDIIVTATQAAYGSRFASHAPTLSESRAAKRLGLSTAATAGLCLLEYGDFLDDVTDRLAGENATPQLRGRHTREVLKQLDLILDRIFETGKLPSYWFVHKAEHADEPDPQWLADHLDQLDYAAKHGDTEAEQEAYEDLP